MQIICNGTSCWVPSSTNNEGAKLSIACSPLLPGVRRYCPQNFVRHYLVCFVKFHPQLASILFCSQFKTSVVNESSAYINCQTGVRRLIWTIIHNLKWGSFWSLQSFTLINKERLQNKILNFRHFTVFIQYKDICSRILWRREKWKVD